MIGVVFTRTVVVCGDQKLQLAFLKTKYKGSYITDLIKYKNFKGEEFFKNAKSKQVVQYMVEHPDIYRKNVDIFERELGCFDHKPILFAFGDIVYKMLLFNPNIVPTIRLSFYRISRVTIAFPTIRK